MNLKTKALLDKHITKVSPYHEIETDGVAVIDRYVVTTDGGEIRLWIGLPTPLVAAFTSPGTETSTTQMIIQVINAVPYEEMKVYISARVLETGGERVSGSYALASDFYDDTLSAFYTNADTIAAAYLETLARP